MTSLAYGLDVPYEVQLEHDAATSGAYMTVLEPQRSPGHGAARHHLLPGVYMVSLAYNGAQRAILQHVGGGPTNSVSVPEGAAGTPRTSAPIKISVQGTSEYLQVSAAASTGGSARATISVIPAATFDEMAESAQGVSVLSEISNRKSTKADKSALESTNYIKGSANDLNALTSNNDFGMWTTSSNCLNTPGPGFYHVLVYGTPGTTHRIQKATRYGSQAAPSEHIRVLDTNAEGVWGPWERVDIRTDTTAGTQVFAGDTMVYGDTGLREIDKENVKSGRICLSRYGSLVNIHFDNVILNDAPGTAHLSRLAVPYRPDNDVRFSLYATGAASSSSSANISSGGYFNVYGLPEDTSVSGQATYTTSRYWPSSLPGDPA